MDKKSAACIDPKIWLLYHSLMDLYRENLKEVKDLQGHGMKFQESKVSCFVLIFKRKIIFISFQKKLWELLKESTKQIKKKLTTIVGGGVASEATRWLLWSNYHQNYTIDTFLHSISNFKVKSGKIAISDPIWPLHYCGTQELQSVKNFPKNKCRKDSINHANINSKLV